METSSPAQDMHISELKRPLVLKHLETMALEKFGAWFKDQNIAVKLATIYVGWLVVGHILEFLVVSRWKAKASKRKLGMPKPYVGLPNILPFGVSTTMVAVVAFILRLENHMIQHFQKQIGHTFLTYLTGRPLVVTDDPENIKALLATNFKDYTLGTRWEMFYSLLGNGIFTLSGEGWKHSRTLLRPQFARDQISHLASIVEHVNYMIARFDAAAAKQQYADLQDLMHCLTLDTATEFLFGESTDTLNGKKEGREFAVSFGYAQEVLAYRFMSGPLWRLVDGFGFRKHCNRCKKFVDYFVQRALQSPMEKEQVADKFVFINELTKETRDPVVIRDQAINILLAGRDTTASTMSFMATYLARHPQVYQRLRQEILDDFGTGTDKISFESLKRCKYLHNVINEILRLHPIVAINFRNAIRDTTLPRGGGADMQDPVFIPKNTTILYSVWSMHHSTDYWGPEAEKFNPDRWDDIKGHSWEFLPFNGGPRICLGQQFALTEIACTWVRLCQTYSRLELDPNCSAAKCDNLPRQRQHQRLTISVDGGVPVKFHRYPRRRAGTPAGTSAGTPARRLHAPARQPTKVALTSPSTSQHNIFKLSQTSSQSGDNAEEVIEYQIESQRGLFLLGVPLFTASWLLPCDPAPFTNLEGRPVGRELNHLQVPSPNWEWAWPNWCVDMRGQIDYHGWCYNVVFKKRHWNDGNVRFKCFVRQRRWKRLRKRVRDLSPAESVLFDAEDLLSNCRNDRERVDALAAYLTPETIEDAVANKSLLLAQFVFPDSVERLRTKTPLGDRFLDDPRK